MCLLMWLVLPLLTTAQQTQLTVSTKTTVEVGEQFRVVFELNADGSDFRGPDFQGFTVLSGPMVSTSSNIQVINGKINQSYTQSYTYIIRADQKGEYSIGSASAVVNKQKISSDRVKLTVVTPTKSTSSGQGSGTTGQSAQEAETLSSKDLFLRAIPDKRTAYVGEQVIVTYQLYTRVPISTITINKLSSFPGFWTKNLTDNAAAYTQSSQTIDGYTYTLAEIRKVAIYPQKGGELTIDPMELLCKVQLRVQPSRQRSYDPFEQFFNDPFFNRSIRNVEKVIASDAVTIQVQPIPAAKRPNNFNGAVGQYNFQTSTDRTVLKANEAMNLTLSVSGKGNIELIDLPKPSFPPDFEVYDPKVSSDIKTGPSGVSGTKKVEYLIIPRYQGSYTLTPIEFSYFDPTQKEYITISSPQYDILVEKGSEHDEGSLIAGPAQEGIRYLGSDIMHIKTQTNRLHPVNRFFFASTNYILINLLLIALFVAAVWIARRNRNLRQNQTLLKNKQATKVAKKRLQTAEKHLKRTEQNEFYAEISQALWGYTADKFSIPLAELSIDNVRTVLSEKELDESMIELFVQALHNCEFARFAPGDAERKMEELYQQGIQVITKAERILK